MSVKMTHNLDKDEIDEILLKIVSGRTVVKSLAEKAISFYMQRKQDFFLFEEFYRKTHSNDLKPEVKQNEFRSHRESTKDTGEEEEAKFTTVVEELKELRNETQTLTDENRKLQEELERAPKNESQKASQIDFKSGLNDSSGDVDKLKQQTIDFDETLDTKTQEIKTRQNESPGQEMIKDDTEDVNPSDTYTPANLAERFRQVYEQEWKRVFDELLKTNSEESILIDSLASVLKEIDKLCSAVSKQQFENIKKHALEEITYPKYRLESGDVMGGLHRAIVEDHQNELANKLLADFRKHLGILSVGPLYQIFSNYQTQLPDTSEFMKKFIMKTTEVVWMMKIQEPPMELEWTYSGFTYDRTKFTVYRDNGNVVKKCVWPAVCSYLEGPLLAKGVILTK